MSRDITEKYMKLLKSRLDLETPDEEGLVYVIMPKLGFEQLERFIEICFSKGCNTIIKDEKKQYNFIDAKKAETVIGFIFKIIE